VILDTCFIIDLIAEDPDAVSKLDDLDDQRLGVSALTIYEVGVGLSDRERRKFNGVMDRLTVYEFGQKVASRAVAEQRSLINNGEQIGVVDAMIGATALSTQQSVLTNNVSEFEQMGCTVEQY
jgi:predicted nucleic acid-binding protein